MLKIITVQKYHKLELSHFKYCFRVGGDYWMAQSRAKFVDGIYFCKLIIYKKIQINPVINNISKRFFDPVLFAFLVDLLNY